MSGSFLNFRSALPTNNGRLPRRADGAPGLGQPAALPTTLDFTNQDTLSFDLTTSAVQSDLDTIQGAYLDNSLNPFKLSLFFGGTLQRIVCPPYSIATFPILGTASGLCTAASGSQAKFSGAGGVAQLYFMNVPMPFATWSSREYGLDTNFAQNTFGTGAQKVLARNPLRRRFMIINNSSGSIAIVFSNTAPASSVGLGIGASGFYDSGPDSHGCYIGDVWTFTSAGAVVATFEFVDCTQPVAFSTPHNWF